ncbi:MAG TPA: FkbM family methyltransferase [Vicinamibacterales bacterium]|nr:FkbM family methyltransferase [Vicinamibacterales bacterium]
MSRFDRALGLVRSLAIYRAIPLRQQRLRRLYRAFVSPGDLVFDIGAHAGNRVGAFASLGCRVVAVEPQPDFAWLLRRLFQRSSDVVIVEAAVSDAIGHQILSLSERTPTVTTLEGAWRDARARDPDFARVRWNRRIEVTTITLDLLIERFGMPAFMKIDVEGSEPAVLAGLTQPLPALSFEYLPRALGEVDACIHRLRALGRYRFNWSIGESGRMESTRWLDDQELLEALRTPAAQRRSGDVYARRS